MKSLENKGCGPIALLHAAFVVAALTSVWIGISNNNFDVTSWVLAMIVIYASFALIVLFIIMLSKKSNIDDSSGN